MGSLISGERFAEIADFKFSEEVNLNLLNIDFKDNQIIHFKNENHICYINKNLALKDNDIIFCKTDFVELLFFALKNTDKVKNLTLITHQSDRKVGNYLNILKPKCISKWFTVNPIISSEDLIPIPLGIANSTSNLNIKIDHFLNLKKTKTKIENKNVYANFNLNTNYFHRFKVLKDLKKFEDIKFDISEKLEIEEYIQKIKENRYIICPEGNGPDTHRFWEVLYLGSIPIVFKNVHNKNLRNLPAIFIDKIEDINYLNQDLGKTSNKKLYFEYWQNLISKNQTTDSKKVYILYNKKIFYLIYKLLLLKQKIYSYSKQFKFLFIKIHKKVSKIV